MKKVFLFALLIVSGPWAWAQSVAIEDSTPAYTIEYFANTTLYTQGEVTLTFTRPKNNRTTYYVFLGVSPTVANRNSWTKVGTSTNVTRTYNVYTNSSYTTVMNPGATHSSTITGLVKWTLTAPADTSTITTATTTIPYYVKVTANSGSLAAGTWEEVLTFNAYLGTSSTKTGSTKSTKNSTLSIVSGKTATLTIGGPDYSNGTVNLGTVSAGSSSSKTFTVTVSSNFRYNLSASSLNGGTLLNPDADAGESIGYTLTIGQLSAATLSTTSMAVAQNQPYDGYTGTISPPGDSTTTTPIVYTGVVNLGTVNAVTAGDYTDTITFSVANQ